MRKRIFQITALVTVLGALIGAFLLLHQTLFRQARLQPSYQVAVADFDVKPPARYDRKEFLDEVRYIARWPPYFRLLDDDLPTRLAKGFARHPWVADVQEVRVLPSRVVRITLSYREPVMAVKLGDTWRAVDCDGVLLPRNARIDGLPKFMGDAKPPSGPAGSRWGDPAVEKAAAQFGSTE